MNAQKEMAQMLAKAGMPAEAAAMYTAVLNYMMQENEAIGALLSAAQKIGDREYKAKAFKAVMNRVSEVILENPEMIKAAMA